jgi:5'-methylthioadenosine/S-adenosylhomocysteine nucleosidase
VKVFEVYTIYLYLMNYFSYFSNLNPLCYFDFLLSQTMTKPIEKVAIIMAMKQEAKPLIEEYNFYKLPKIFDEELPMEAYHIDKEGIDITIILNGTDRDFQLDCVATQPATLSAFLAVQHFRPDLIINAGTAGGFAQRGSEIGDVYVSHKYIRYHDRRIPLPGFDKYGMGNYPCLNASRLAQKLGMKLANVSTGNSLDITPTDLAIINIETPVVKEMEAAAIAWVAHLYRIPFIAVKSITDLIDNEQAVEQEFIKNLAIASNNLKKKMMSMIDYLVGKTIEEI